MESKMKQIAIEKGYPYCEKHDVIYSEYCCLCGDGEVAPQENKEAQTQQATRATRSPTAHD